MFFFYRARFIFYRARINLFSSLILIFSQLDFLFQLSFKGRLGLRNEGRALTKGLVYKV